jgi:hypothetical protein
VEGDPIWPSRAEEEARATARKSHAWAQRTTAHRDAASSGRGRGGRPGSRASLGGGRAEAERLEEEGTRGARRWETQSSRAGEKWSAVRGAARMKEGGARGKERAEARTRLPEDACFGRLFVSCDAGGFCAKRGRQKLPRICAFGRGFCFWRPEAAQNLNQTGALLLRQNLRCVP